MRQGIIVPGSDGRLVIPGPGVAIVLVCLSPGRNLSEGEASYNVVQTDSSAEPWVLWAGMKQPVDFRAQIVIDSSNLGALSSSRSYRYAVAQTADEAALLSPAQLLPAGVQTVQVSGSVAPAGTHAEVNFNADTATPLEGTTLVDTGPLVAMTVDVRVNVIDTIDEANDQQVILQHVLADGTTVVGNWRRPAMRLAPDIVVDGLQLAAGDSLRVKTLNADCLGKVWVSLTVRQEG